MGILPFLVKCHSLPILAFLIQKHMGRGDKKTKKGKIAIGSYGVSRNKKAIKAQMKRVASKPSAVVETAAAEKPKVKRAAKKKEAAE